MKSFIIFLFSLFSTLTYGQGLTLYDLTCEHLDNPLGIDIKNPRFSWKIQTSERNMTQMAYAIRVSETPLFSGKMYWESGKVNSQESVLVSYEGPELKSTQRYYWQVKIWDDNQNESENGCCLCCGWQ